MIPGDRSRNQKTPFIPPSRYARVQHALADASDETVRLWLAAAENAADNSRLPADARLAARVHAAACRDLLAWRHRGRSRRAAATGVEPTGAADEAIVQVAAPLADTGMAIAEG